MVRISQLVATLFNYGVIESGEFGGWNYKKYGDGAYEATRVDDIATGTLTSGSNSIGSATINYPSPPSGVSEVIITPALVKASTGTFWLAAPSNATACTAYRNGSTGAATLTIKFSLTGRWK